MVAADWNRGREVPVGNTMGNMAQGFLLPQLPDRPAITTGRLIEDALLKNPGDLRIQDPLPTSGGLASLGVEHFPERQREGVASDTGGKTARESTLRSELGSRVTHEMAAGLREVQSVRSVELVHVAVRLELGEDAIEPAKRGVGLHQRDCVRRDPDPQPPSSDFDITARLALGLQPLCVFGGQPPCGIGQELRRAIWRQSFRYGP